MVLYKGNITGREQRWGGGGKQEGNTQKKENKTKTKQQQQQNMYSCGTRAIPFTIVCLCIL